PSHRLGRARRVTDAAARYRAHLESAAPPGGLSGLRIVVDAAHGAAYRIAPQLFAGLGAEVEAIGVSPDGLNINEGCGALHPEPLAARVRERGADLGIALDGDGDRLGVVTPSGAIIWPDRQLMLYAADVLSRNPGAEIIYDVKCTRLLAPWIERHGGRPVIWKTGHSFIKAKLAETGALLAGEMSGHIFFRERWYGFDDGLYAGARLLEIVSREADPGAALEALPDAPATPELNWKLAEGEPLALIARLQQAKPFPSARRILTIDGVRVEYDDGFGLARPSNTTPVVVLRFEADTPQALARIQHDFRRALQAVKPDAALPF
ncbi:MAG: phosphomannomutase/phosphoglucomutase, partial [Casimicrobiaceae bacterium]|nr:phosphomannomutase/phosphoglucomutase [Casimicrobiaceae bacterium]